MSEKNLEAARNLADALEKADVNVPDGAIEETAPPVKRGPGRPKGSTNKPEFETIGQETAKKPTGAKRGPKPGSRNAPKTNVAELGKQIVGIHVMVSMVTGIPELVLTEDEGTNLAKAVVGVAEQYNLAIDGKTGAAIQLLAAVAMIYGPRALMIRSRMANQQTIQEHENSGKNIVPIN